MAVRECLGGSWAGRGLLVFLLIALMVVCGCGRTGQPSRPMASVSGTVSLDGQPLPDGFVTFVSPQQGFFEAFPIKEGRYTGKAGLGTRRVEIIAVREEQPSQTTSRDNEPPRPQRENYLPAKYSTKSTLTAEVTRDGPNVFDFNLTIGK
jgi:hypothetical protein